MASVTHIMQQAGGGGSVDWAAITNKPVFTATSSFTNANQVTFTHNMQKYPAVYVEDSAGTHIIPTSINYPTLNSIEINFDTSFSGNFWLS